jgi:hypothetical protein
MRSVTFLTGNLAPVYFMGSHGFSSTYGVMNRTSGRAAISLSLIDGPVLLTHPELASEHIREVAGNLCPQRQRGLHARNVADFSRDTSSSKKYY